MGLKFSRSAKVASVGLLALAFCCAPGMCTDVVTLPETGCDIGALIGAMVTKLGPVVQVAVAAAFAFLVIRLGMKWGKKAA